MTSTIVYMSRDQVAARRAALLENVGLDLDSLRQLGERYQLTPDQAAVLRELEKLEFLDGK